MKEEIRKVLMEMPERNASDLHISANSVLRYRIDNDLVDVSDKVQSSEDTKALVYSLLDDDQIRRFEEAKELDFSFELENTGRYRVNVFFQRGHVGCAIRLIPLHIMSLEECGLPEQVVRKFCEACRGRGCEVCLRTGFRGRVLLAEHLRLDDRLRAAARAEGTRVLCSDRPLSVVAEELSISGVTGVAEVGRIVGT